MALHSLSKNVQQLIEVYQNTNAFGKHLNLKLEEVGEGEVTYYLQIEQPHLATPHAAHGGVIAAMMDGVLGVAALTVSAEKLQLVSTVEFKINYISPAYVNDKLIGKGKVLKAGKRIIVSEGEIFEAASKRIIAKAIGTFNAYPYQKAGIEALKTVWENRQ